MAFGIVVSSVDDIDLVAQAEELGYDYCWAPDSQLLYSDPLPYWHSPPSEPAPFGSVLVLLSRACVVRLCREQMATINRLAPGRAFLGLGTGELGAFPVGAVYLRPRLRTLAP